MWKHEVFFSPSSQFRETSVAVAGVPISLCHWDIRCYVRCNSRRVSPPSRQRTFATLFSGNSPGPRIVEYYAPNIRRTGDLSWSHAWYGRGEPYDACRNGAIGSNRSAPRHERGGVSCAAAVPVSTPSASQRLGACLDRWFLSGPLICSVAHNFFHGSQTHLGVALP